MIEKCFGILQLDERLSKTLYNAQIKVNEGKKNSASEQNNLRLKIRNKEFQDL